MGRCGGLADALLMRRSLATALRRSLRRLRTVAEEA
jgi:hypothetical protein